MKTKIITDGRLRRVVSGSGRGWRLRWSWLYFLLSVVIFWVEVFIALRMHDAIIRPYGGDVLVVILLYCMVRSLFDAPVWPLAIGVLGFAYMVEVSQYFGLADRLGLAYGSWGRILLGSYFTWVDILSYTLGILLVLGCEKLVFGRNVFGRKKKLFL